MLSAIGVALVAVPTSQLHLDTSTSRSEMLDWWLMSLKNFAIPVVLLILRLFHKSFARTAGLFWGLWIAIGFDLGRLTTSPNSAPNATILGQFLASLTLILSVALVLFSIIELNLTLRTQRPLSPPIRSEHHDAKTGS